MQSPALALFESLATYEKLQELIDSGEAEGLHLECKAPREPHLTRDLRAQMAEAISGFSNTGGGTLIWGISTTRHAHSGLDILTQLEPIGDCRKLAQEIDKAIATSTYPAVAIHPCRVLRKARGDSRGVIITYVPPTSGDPIQSLVDKKFYFRNGDAFAEMPYEMLRRMFIGVAAPDLTPRFESRLVKLEPGGRWKIPIILVNLSSTAAEQAIVLVGVLNPDSCQEISVKGFYDISEINPGEKLYRSLIEHPVHRGLDQMVGSLSIVMKTGKRPRRSLSLKISVFSNRMRARAWVMTVQLAKKGFSVRKTGDEYLY